MARGKYLSLEEARKTGQLKKKVAPPADRPDPSPPAPARQTETQESAPEPPAQRVDPIEPGPELWRTALAAHGRDARYQWMTHLEFLRYADYTMRFRLKDGQGALLGFINGQRDGLADLLSKMSTAAVKVAVEPPLDDSAEQSRASRTTDAQRLTAEQRNEAMNLPLVRQVADLFDGRVVDVRDEQPSEPREEA